MELFRTSTNPIFYKWGYDLIYYCNYILVREEGFEPSRPRGQRIFLLLHVAMAALHQMRCSLDYIFTIYFYLGGRCIVSTHLFWVNIFSSICIS